MKNEAFTLIELLVVISIIALLSSVTLVAVSNARSKAKTTKVIADFKQIQTQIDITRNSANATMIQITGSGCSDCAFRDGNPVNSNSAGLTGINNAWRLLGFIKTPIDPWGSPYLFDENEREGGVSDCRYDLLFTAGPNGIDETGGGDDTSVDVRHWICP